MKSYKPDRLSGAALKPYLFIVLLLVLTTARSTNAQVNDRDADSNAVSPRVIAVNGRLEVGQTVKRFRMACFLGFTAIMG